MHLLIIPFTTSKHGTGIVRVTPNEVGGVLKDTLLEEIDRARRKLARRFVEASSPSERFAISREISNLLDDRHDLLRTMQREHVAAG